MPRTYHHLCAEERALIMIERQNGSSLRHIAARLGRSPSTISREVRRIVQNAPYDAARAARSYRDRRRH
ncbi:helix-turn-helix domain-containing protein, partial [Luteibacter sp.]|uniref:helix-turn-helix domain-containing protein n=1 Tax=Luteibacter sp. TaxID=1886636 RepID=UPI0039C9342A